MRRLLLALALAACQKTPAPPPAPAAAPAAPAAAPATPAAEAHRTGALTWIADDYPAALAAARKAQKPIVVDAWTLWCHTCRSMQSFVLADPGLGPQADRFVWLALDYEKPENAQVVARFPADAFPTFFVIDPADESVHGRWLGAASLEQLRAFLADGERSVQLAHADRLRAGDPLGLLRRGDEAATRKQYAEAAKLYAQAQAAAPAEWPRRPDVLVAQMQAVSKLDDPGACVDLGLREMDRTGRSSSATDFASWALGCADQLPASDARAGKLRKLVAARLAALADDTGAPLSADDRGDALGYLAEVRQKLGDEAGAAAAHRKRLQILDEAAGRAPDASSASTFDWARAESYLALGRGDQAIRLLEKSERDLPSDYNPPHRLARVHLMLGRYGEALAAADRALAKAYGPRKAGILTLKADILEKQGRPEDARKVVEEEVALWASLPAGQKRPAAEAAAQKRLAALKGTATTSR